MGRLLSDPRALAVLGLVLLGTHGLTAHRAWHWSKQIVEARVAAEAARTTDDLAEATETARIAQAALQRERQARKALIERIEDDTRADPLAPHRLPSDRSLQRLQLRWGPPPAASTD